MWAYWKKSPVKTWNSHDGLKSVFVVVTFSFFLSIFNNLILKWEQLMNQFSKTNVTGLLLWAELLQHRVKCPETQSDWMWMTYRRLSQPSFCWRFHSAVMTLAASRGRSRFILPDSNCSDVFNLYVTDLNSKWNHLINSNSFRFHLQSKWTITNDIAEHNIHRVTSRSTHVSLIVS